MRNKLYNTAVYSLGDLEQRMDGGAQLAQMLRHVSYLVAEQPPEAEERRRVADHLLGLGHHAVPVGSLRATAPDAVRGDRGGRGRAVRAPQPPDGRGRRGGGRRGVRDVHVRLQRRWVSVDAVVLADCVGRGVGRAAAGKLQHKTRSDNARVARRRKTTQAGVNTRQ